LHAPLDALPLPLMRLNAKRRIEAVNLATEEALNVSRKRLLGSELACWFQPEAELERLFDRARTQPAVSYALRYRQTPAAVWLARDEKGAWLQFVLEGARSEMEELARRGEMADAMARMALELAHELKNPLAAIRGAAQWLCDRLPQRAWKEAAARIVEGSERMRARIDALLQLAPRAAVPMRPVNLHRLIDEVSANVPRGVRLRRIFDPALPEVWAHEARLRQALENLWTNAIEAGASWIEWRTSAAPLARIPGIEGRIVELSIRNDGATVPEELRARIFEPFVSSKARGSGLGLAVVERVMREHGGRAQLLAEQGRTTIVLQLPVRPPHAKEEQSCAC